MNPNRGLTLLIIEYYSNYIKPEDEEEVCTNAWVSFLLFCKHNFQGRLLIYPYSYFLKKDTPIIIVDLDKDLDYFTMISEKVSNFAIEEGRHRFYGEFDLVQDLYVFIDWHANYFLIERKKRSCFRKIYSFFNTCRNSGGITYTDRSLYPRLGKGQQESNKPSE